MRSADSEDIAAGRFFTVDGHRIAARALDPGLYIVATPIGQSWRYFAPRPRHAGGGRSGRLRGYTGHGLPAASLRHRIAAARLSRPQCREAAAEASGGAGRGQGGGAGQRCRYAADLRSRLQAGRGSPRRRTCGGSDPRRLGAARRPRRRRPADRHVPLRRLPAAEGGRAPDTPRRTRPACRRRWSSTRAARGSPRRLPTWPRCWAIARASSPAS